MYVGPLVNIAMQWYFQDGQLQHARYNYDAMIFISPMIHNHLFCG